MSQVLVSRRVIEDEEPEQAEVVGIDTELESRRPSDTSIGRAVEYLTRHPEEMTAQQCVRLLEHLVVMDVNEAEILVKSSLDTMCKTNAVQRQLTELYLNGAALAFGRRLIDDTKVQAALRRAKDSRQLARGGFAKKFVYLIREVLSSDEQKFAEILRETEELSANNEAIRLENKRLLAENEMTNRNTRAALEGTATEVRQILEGAEREANNKVSAAERKESGLNRKCITLEKRIASLEICKADLLKNPEIAKIGDIDEKLDFQNEMDSLSIMLEAAKFHVIYNGGTIEVARKVKDLFIFFGKILTQLDSIETRYGIRARTLAAHKLTEKSRQMNREILSADGLINCRFGDTSGHNYTIIKQNSFLMVWDALKIDGVNADNIRDCLAKYESN